VHLVGVLFSIVIEDARNQKPEKNQCIRGKTGIQNIVKEIKHYREKWLQNVHGMDTNRIPKQALQYVDEGT
jgi:hypothetical protein